MYLLIGQSNQKVESIVPSWLVRWTLDWIKRETTVSDCNYTPYWNKVPFIHSFYSWARIFTCTVPLSTEHYNGYQLKLNAQGNPVIVLHSIQRGVHVYVGMLLFSSFMLQKPNTSTGLMVCLAQQGLYLKIDIIIWKNMSKFIKWRTCMYYMYAHIHHYCLMAFSVVSLANHY